MLPKSIRRANRIPIIIPVELDSSLAISLDPLELIATPDSVFSELSSMILASFSITSSFSIIASSVTVSSSIGASSSIAVSSSIIASYSSHGVS
jgi:hypothetical protein